MQPLPLRLLSLKNESGCTVDPTIVNSRTMVVVMPYFPKDLKRVLKSTRKHGEVFQDARAVRVMYHLLLAVRHLKAHAIVHRDIKLDNVLLANVGTEEEAAVLTDFGMCCKCSRSLCALF